MVGLNNVMIVQNSSDGEGAGLYVSSYEGAYTMLIMFNVDIKIILVMHMSGMKLRGNIQACINSSFVGNQAQAYAAAGGATDGAFAFHYCTLIAKIKPI